jgi:hypothetical protein
LFYVGARRLEHLQYLVGDPVVTRFCGLARLPSSRTVSHWLKQFTQATLAPLVELNHDLVAPAPGVFRPSADGRAVLRCRPTFTRNRWWRGGHVLFERPMDPDDLLDVEERLEAEHRGQPTQGLVRLPEQ